MMIVPSRSSLTSLAAFSPSALSSFSICLDLSDADLSSALAVQPISTVSSPVLVDTSRSLPAAPIYIRMQWRHSNLWSRYDRHVVGQLGVFCVKWEIGNISFTFFLWAVRAVKSSGMTRLRKRYRNLAPHYDSESAAIDMDRRNHVPVNLCMEALKQRRLYFITTS